MIISKQQVQDACRGPITYPKIQILCIRLKSNKILEIIDICVFM